ncbi:uncharacterized protein LOC144703428 [Wolffia australiana]
MVSEHDRSHTEASIKKMGENFSVATNFSANEIAMTGQAPITVPTRGIVLTKLNGDNFRVWKSAMVPILNGYDLMRFVEGFSPPVSIADDQGNIVAPHISRARSSKEALDKLESVFSIWDQERIMDLQRKFHNMRKGARSTEDYVRYFRSVVEALDAAGQPPYEQAKIDTFLRGLGSAYSAFIVSINANIGHLKFDEIISNLKAQEAYLRFEEESENFPPMANNAQRSQHGYNRREFNNN